MSLSSLNPIRRLLLFVGYVLSRLGLVDARHVKHSTDLAWPRIVTGLARMSKSAADVAMVGVALGPAAIAGVGIASPFWGLAFALGGGIAGGTIGRVSQSYGADDLESLALAVKASAALAVLVSLPLVVAFWSLPAWLVGLVGSDAPAAIHYGATYLQVVALGVPFAALNLVGSRVLVGADDAWTAMVLRAGGAAVNLVANTVLIFGLGMGVTGAALGTVFGNVVVTVGFAVGLSRGHLPLVGALPVRIPISGPHIDLPTVRDLVRVSAPLVGTNLARSGAEFPKLAIVALFGPNVVAAFVIAQRIRGLMDTPGWGFSLASSSLVGQELGVGDELEAEAWARDVLRLAVAVYLAVGLATAAVAPRVARLFTDEAALVPLVTAFVYAACASVVFRGVDGGATGPLRASGDTKWPLYSQLVGMYLVVIPLLYLGTVTPLGITALYLGFVAETLVPASVTYHRFRSGTWKVVSRSYRPSAAPGD